ncbi:MAG: methyltransferase domain-containing protein [Candidatus Taylorbacteria bacterium]|nr:methyltransferase domain-containing protein [Candidatus Taylorbacteria bacterium]
MFSDPGANIAKLGVTDGMRIVDFGAGSGFYSIEAAKKVGASGHIYAVDVQKNLLGRLRSMALAQGLKNIEVIWGNVEKIGGSKLKDGIADRAIVSNILFEIGKMDDFALEIKRVVKPGGKVMVVEWDQASHMPKEALVPKAKAETTFEKCGFKLEQSFSAGASHYGLIFART